MSAFFLTRTKLPFSLARTKLPFSLARTKLPFSLTRTKLPFSLARTKLPFILTRTKLPFSLTRTKLPFSLTRTKLPFSLTRATMAFILLLMITTTCASQAEVIQTTLGPIQGLRKTVQGKLVDVYYSIPFAKPPVGELRFKRPQPAEPWTDVKSTVTKPNACMQTIDTSFDQFPGVDMWNPKTPVSEDCLYLNVWVPRGFESNPRTTMVWIYGGGFYSGSSALDVYDGSKLAVSQNVIVASMNYRLGPLGFLYTGTTDAPGNQGLLDQALALKWIYDNAVSFGGQQNSITIFGESAGSFSVGLHLLSPMSMDFFTRAIMESGGLTQLLPQAEAIRRAEKLSAMFNCSQTSVNVMMQCIREVSAENLTTAQWALTDWDLPMRPVVDDYFLKDDAQSLMARGAVKDTELLLGVNKDEGMYFLLYQFPDLFSLNISKDISEQDLKHLVHIFNKKREDFLDEAVIYEYVDRGVPALRKTYRNIASDIKGDMSFVCPVTDLASTFNALKGHRNVYLYSFEHKLSNNPWPDWTGVMHGYEIEAVFDLPRPFNYTQEELDLADRMTSYWTRFAETGNPNPGEALVWPKLTAQEAQYLKLTAQGDSVEQGLHRQPCSFLSTILPLLESVKESSQCPTAKGQVMLSSALLAFSMASVSALWSILTFT